MAATARAANTTICCPLRLHLCRLRQRWLLIWLLRWRGWRRRRQRRRRVGCLLWRRGRCWLLLWRWQLHRLRLMQCLQLKHLPRDDVLLRSNHVLQRGLQLLRARWRRSTTRRRCASGARLRVVWLLRVPPTSTLLQL
jgi:hypothetical protein